MNRNKIVAIVLLVIMVLPATLILLLLGFIGFPFWILGVIDFISGGYGWDEFISEPRPEIAALFLSAPLGIFGLVILWYSLINLIRCRSFNNPLLIYTGLICGVVASINLIFMKNALPLVLIPSVIFIVFNVVKYNGRLKIT